MRKLWITLALAGSAGLGGLAFVQGQEEQVPVEGAASAEALPDGRVQPIQFSHSVHAGTYQMDCQYCHFSAERSVDAGIPPVATCWGCHQTILGTTEAQQAEITKVRDAYTTGTPIEWVRIYKVADHAHFPHMRHVNAGLTCQQCHGEVQEMGPIERRDPAWGGDSMGWCVSCHVDLDVTRDCTVCHY
jgi:predicted CxxxxCH...CXXCH cytochrome family protein